jgi:hypothetical protein
MRRALIFISTVAVALSLWAGSEASAAPRAAITRVLPCVGASEVRPGKYVLACGDGNFYVTSLRWVRWSASVGIARGVANLNDCQPTCADGRFHSTSAVIVFSDPVSRRGAELFSVATVLDATRLPGSSTTTLVQPLPLTQVR